MSKKERTAFGLFVARDDDNSNDQSWARSAYSRYIPMEKMFESLSALLKENDLAQAELYRIVENGPEIAILRILLLTLPILRQRQALQLKFEKHYDGAGQLKDETEGYWRREYGRFDLGYVCDIKPYANFPRGSTSKQVLRTIFDDMERVDLVLSCLDYDYNSSNDSTCVFIDRFPANNRRQPCIGHFDLFAVLYSHLEKLFPAIALSFLCEMFHDTGLQEPAAREKQGFTVRSCGQPGEIPTLILAGLCGATLFKPCIMEQPAVPAVATVALSDDDTEERVSNLF